MGVIPVITTPDGQTIPVRAEYSVMKATWELNKEAYDGLGGFLTGAQLIAYPRETDESLDRRKENCHYSNYVQAIADTVGGHLFKQDITRKIKNKILEEWITATNKIGNVPMTKLMKKAFLKSLVCGHSWVLIDKPAKEASNLDEEMREGMPYAYVLDATKVIDWLADEHGQLIWVKVLESFTTDAENPFADHETKTLVRVWTRSAWFLMDGKTVIGQNEHNLGRVPIVQIVNKESQSMPAIGTSELNTIVKKAHRLFNVESELDQLLRSCVFPLLTYPGQETFEQEAATGDTTSEKNNVTLSSSTILSYPADQPHKPEFISPGSDSTDAYFKTIEQLINMMWEMARLNFIGGVQSSGVAMAFEFEKTNQSLLDKAGTLRDAEVEILEIVAAWMGQDSKDTEISYPKDFNLRDLERELENHFKALTLNLSERFNKEYKKKASRKILSDLTPEKQAEIDKEIEEGEELPNIESMIDDEDDDE
jgi:hypothetical protein